MARLCDRGPVCSSSKHTSNSSHTSAGICRWRVSIRHKRSPVCDRPRWGSSGCGAVWGERVGRIVPAIAPAIQASAGVAILAIWCWLLGTCRFSGSHDIAALPVLEVKRNRDRRGAGLQLEITVSRVRIHLPPPCSLNCRETLLRCSKNKRKTRVFGSIDCLAEGGEFELSIL